jgi:glycosyltransferase involved in cell wall biosynthesis
MVPARGRNVPDRAVSSLVVLHFGSNVGYAIAELERMFFRICVDLAGGDAGRVHFGYPDFAKGHPRTLPDSFRNLVEFDYRDRSPQSGERLAQYVREHRIEFALFFDVQPIHPVFGRIRAEGIRTILSYWGAPIASPQPSWKLLLKRLEVSTSRSRLDGLIFESRAMADLAVNGRGVPESMIDIVPLGVDLDLFKAGATDYVYQACGFPREKKVVIYAGHVDERKGIRTLVEAAIELLHRRQRQDVLFLVCGNKGDESKPYEALYDGLGIGESIVFGGYRADLPLLYPSCLCGVIPSSGWDSFPRTAVEMAASGIPVVASRLQGLPEAVLEGQTGLLFTPGDAQGLAGCLERLLDDPEQARALGQAGRRRCERELNLAVQRRRLTEVALRRIGTQAIPVQQREFGPPPTV